jgi:hypothetical protein
MNNINKHIDNINKHMDNINKHMDNIHKEMFYKRVYSFNPNYGDINTDIFGCKNKNILIITEKKCIEKHLSSLECININILRYIHFLNKKCCVINISHNNTINFIIQNQLQLKQLLDKLTFVYNNNLYNINLITKKINIINLTTTMFTPFYNV